MPQEPSVVLTGGEPLLQHDEELAAALRDSDIYIAVETSGSVKPRGYFDYVTISPKVSEARLAANFMYADELRYVLRIGDRIPKPKIECLNLFLSPMFDGEKVNQANVDWCVKLVKENPEWRLSIQTHKLAGFR
jgi:organic radical activating enzyme